MRKKISIVTPCRNEEGNIEELRARVVAELDKLDYDHEHIFIDNASTDRTVELIKRMGAVDPRVKLIVNNRNFGAIRSGLYALKQTTGDAVIHIIADLQDPPELIPQMLKLWSSGRKVVYCVKDRTDESFLMAFVRRFYYWILNKISEIELIKNYTGFGLYDRIVIDQLRAVDDRYPYMRGLMAEFGFDSVKLLYRQPKRKRGVSNNNFYSLYDMAMLGITTYSKVPIRICTIGGFLLSLLSFAVAIGYLAAKLIYWNRFKAGIAPMLIGGFAFFSVQLFFLGIIGEYIGFIHTQVLKRPLVVERERMNF